MPFAVYADHPRTCIQLAPSLNPTPTSMVTYQWEAAHTTKQSLRTSEAYRLQVSAERKQRAERAARAKALAAALRGDLARSLTDGVRYVPQSLSALLNSLRPNEALAGSRENT